MNLYLAICNETNTVKIFTNYDDFKEFATKERYSFTYFKLGDVEEIPDVDLFYSEAKE